MLSAVRNGAPVRYAISLDAKLMNGASGDRARTDNNTRFSFSLTLEELLPEVERAHREGAESASKNVVLSGPHRFSGRTCHLASTGASVDE